MKRLAMITCVAILAACGSKSTPTTPSNPNVVTFKANLSGQNEVPPITNAESGGTGTATITLNLTRDASNNITGGTASWTFNVAGLPNGTTLILNHIHEAAPGVNGGVVINSGLSAGTALVLPNGTLANQTFSNLTPQNNDFGVFQRMITNPNGFYFNVHSPLNGGGVIRGPLVIQ
jgi:hypothetical protein